MFYYQEFQPDGLLVLYIDKYWVAQGLVAESFNMKVLPDGCIDIIFAWNDSAVQRNMTEATPYVIGGGDTFLEEIIGGCVKMFGIRFKPVGIRAFIRTSALEMTGKEVELSDLDSIFGKDFMEVIDYHVPLTNQIQNIDRYIIGKLVKLYPTESRITKAVEWIERHHGTIAIPILAKEVCLSSRQFERLFKEEVGLSAKAFSRIARMKHTKEYLQNNPEQSIFSAAIDCGYYDYAHLNKEFLILTGELPSFYIP